MPFTDHSDLYAALHEEGMNLVVQHVMLQRPSLFNYGTPHIQEMLKRDPHDPNALCKPIEVIKTVDDRQNPHISVEDPFVLPGTDNLLAVDFLVQLTQLRFDFHPGGVFDLPPELNPPLGEQHFAILVQMCGGVGCPTREFLEEFELPERDNKDRPPPELTVVPFDKLECFCLDLVLLGHFKPAGETLELLLRPDVDGIEFVDLKPEGLETILECILMLLLKVVVLPKLAKTLSKLLKSPLEDLGDFTSLTLVPTPTPAKVPWNPSIDADQVKIFVDLEEVPE